MRKRFLFDCDGVLAGFSQGALDVVEGLTGSRHELSEITGWSITGCPFFKKLAEVHGPELKDAFWRQVGAYGFCSGLPPIEGAREMLDQVRELGDVYVVTSPFDSPTWMREREAWLRIRMGVPSNRVIFASEKHVVRGHFLVDDKPEHVDEWAAENSGGTGFLVDRPYNQGHSLDAGNAFRITKWSDVVQAAR